MELIKKGYQQTEIGVIPMDWKVKSIFDFCNPVRGGSPRPAGDFRYFNGNFIPWLTVASLTNIPSSQVFVRRTNGFLTELGSHYSRILEKGTFIIANSGATLGISKILEIKCCANDGIAALLDFDKSVDSLYLLYYLNTKTIYLREVVATGNGQPNLNTDLIGNLKIPLPPLPEQKAIAEVLSDMDNLITALERQIEKKRLVKQGAMQRLLTAGEDWEVKTLGEVGECIIGLTYRPDNVKSNGILVLRSSNIQNSALAYNNNVFVDLTVSERLINKENDILICVRNGSKNLIGKCALIKGDAIGETFGAFMSMFRSPYNVYLINVFQSHIIKKQIEEHLGATINQITNKSLNSFKVPFPPFEEQTRIATILSDMDAAIEGLEKQLEKYRAVKVGLMQELLSGRKRLIDN
jgi:type I restriction enzyme S subunit